MGEPECSQAPFTRADYESMYWTVLDFLTIPDQPSGERRMELRALLRKLAAHVETLRTGAGAGQNVRKRVDYRSLVRARLLERHNPEEEGVWAIYGEEPDVLGELVLLRVTGGRYREVVEAAFELGGFLTRGMGGQVDRLGE